MTDRLRYTKSSSFLVFFEKARRIKKIIVCRISSKCSYLVDKSFIFRSTNPHTVGYFRNVMLKLILKALLLGVSDTGLKYVKDI